LVSIQDADRTAIEGVLLQVSKLPPAEGNAYPDCYYTATISINQIVSGPSIPRKVILVLPGFISRKYAPEANYKVGDKVRATIVPFSSMPDKVRQTQQADEIEDVYLEFYFPEKIIAIQEFQNTTSSVPFADKSQQPEHPTNPQPLDLKAKSARQEQMQRDLQQINKLLAQHGGDWDKWYDSLKDFRSQYKKQVEENAQRWVGDSFFSAGQIEYGRIYSPEFVKSVVAFKNYLAARNVDLILARVPYKGEIVDDLFATVPADQVSNPYLLRLYKELLEADVEILTDIIPRAKVERLKYPLMYYYQDFAENHPAEGMSWVIADEFSKRLSRYNRIKSMPKNVFTLKPNRKDAPITDGWQNLKWPSGNLKFSTTDNVSFSTVLDDKGRTIELKKGLDSPILVLGSSFIAAPSLSQGATIPHYFAYLSGIIPDLFHRRDADFMMPRSIAREGDDFLQNRVVCLFPFVPWVANKALAQLPIFDPIKSAKTLLASYSGSSLLRTVAFPPDTPAKTFSYSPDGMLRIEPDNKNPETTVSIKVKVPDAIAAFPNFIVVTEFVNNDFASITVRYSEQTDTIKRGISLPNEEAFTFITKSDTVITIDLTTDKFRKNTISIKGFKFFGVKQPTKY
jgi:hypothetical protein